MRNWSVRDLHQTLATLLRAQKTELHCSPLQNISEHVADRFRVQASPFTNLHMEVCSGVPLIQTAISNRASRVCQADVEDHPVVLLGGLHHLSCCCLYSRRQQVQLAHDVDSDLMP